MANQPWYKESNRLAQENKTLKELMISFATKPGQSPGDDKTGDNRHDKDWPPPAPLKPKLAHGEGRGPQPKYHDEYNRPLKIPPWMHINPSGELIEIPCMKEKYENEHPELTRASSLSIRNHLKRGTKGLRDYDKSGGGRGIPEDEWLKLIRSVPLQAHVNQDGTAHDWRAPGHGGLRVPGGEVNPHGRRGTNTWDDGRQKYTPEELKQIEDYMKSLYIDESARARTRT